jgi:hypothetical protein
MERQHLKDEDIQNILDESSIPISEFHMKHLQSCLKCQQTLDNYRILFTELKKDPGFRLPHRVVRDILNQLPQEKKDPFFLSDTFLIAACSTVIAVVLIIFVDFKPVLETLRKMILPAGNIADQAAKPVQNILENLNGNLTLIPFAGLALLMILLLDKLLPRKGGNKLFL